MICMDPRPPEDIDDRVMADRRTEIAEMIFAGFIKIYITTKIQICKILSPSEYSTYAFRDGKIASTTLRVPEGKTLAMWQQSANN
jgi:hypothetical protein